MTTPRFQASPALCLAVVNAAKRYMPVHGFQVSDNAPQTIEALCEHMDRTGRMVVWSGASDKAIWSAYTNYAFRAWHDYHHWLGKLPFTRAGETATCEAQCQDLLTWYGESETTQEWCRVLRAEIIGQLDYSDKHNGAFPEDQAAFVAAYLADPLGAPSLTF